MKSNIIAAFVIGSVLIVSCSSNEPKGDSDGSLTDSSSSTKTRNDSNDLHIFTLPAPLQISTMLKNIDLKFNEKMLVPAKKQLPAFSSNYKRALNMGIQTIDLGYVTVYNQRQSSINYARNIQVMSQDLGITSGISKELLQRFEKNIDKQDSLYRIILQTYSYANQYFQENNREEVGMYILAGSFIEGLYLTLNFKEIPSDNRLLNLIGQQKIFLENIIELIQYTEEKPETIELLKELITLKKEFDPVTVEFNDTNNGRIAVRCNMTINQLEKLLQKTTELRNRMITAS